MTESYIFDLGDGSTPRLSLTVADLSKFSEAVLIAEREFYAGCRLPRALEAGSSAVILGRRFLAAKVAEPTLDSLGQRHGILWLPRPLCGYQVGLSTWPQDLTLVPNVLKPATATLDDWDDKLLADVADLERQAGLSHPSTYPTVDDARLIADRRRQVQVVILSVAGDGRSSVVTWGRETSDKARAADLGEAIWRALGVPLAQTQVREDYRREGEAARRADDLQRQLQEERSANAVLRDELTRITRFLRTL